MRTGRYVLGVVALVMVASLVTSGCAWNFYKQNPKTKQKIVELETQIDDLELQREQERAQFEEARRLLEQKLSGQIGDDSVSLAVNDRGLVIILSDDVLFDSGQAVVKDKAHSVLDKVSSVVKSKVPNKDIGVGGHTDNVPITHSKWESNWELSTARATNVLHYLVSKKVNPGKLSATGYGEHRPIASNNTKEGRSKNRRVEIVILPEFSEKRSGNLDSDISVK